MKLTEKQTCVLNAYRNFARKNGRIPKAQELVKVTKLSETSVHEKIISLSRKKLV